MVRQEERKKAAAQKEKLPTDRLIELILTAIAALAAVMAAIRS